LIRPSPSQDYGYGEEDDDAYPAEAEGEGRGEEERVGEAEGTFRPRTRAFLEIKGLSWDGPTAPLVGEVARQVRTGIFDQYYLAFLKSVGEWHTKEGSAGDVRAQGRAGPLRNLQGQVCGQCRVAFPFFFHYHMGFPPSSHV